MTGLGAAVRGVVLGEPKPVVRSDNGSGGVEETLKRRTKISRSLGFPTVLKQSISRKAAALPTLTGNELPVIKAKRIHKKGAPNGTIGKR